VTSPDAYDQALADFTRAQLEEVNAAMRADDAAGVRHALLRLGLEGDMDVIEHLYRALAADDDTTEETPR
jgi:hypothetical protein